MSLENDGNPIYFCIFASLKKQNMDKIEMVDLKAQYNAV
jgi:hypothetical protein